MVTFEDVQNSPEVRELIKNAQKQLDVLGYTEHSHRHVSVVAERAANILRTLGCDEHRIELAKIAGYMHDIGNAVNRVDHAHSGAILSYQILKGLGMDLSDVVEIMMAIGNHDEGTGVPVNAVAAALILADKANVRRTRVRNTDASNFDIHDQVNYSVKKSTLRINEEKTLIKLKLFVDTQYGSVMDYFEIFMDRMIMCRKAAEKLGLQFKLMINEQQLI
jgi:metal-dependent HD superfamily phosphatase/phosphodiesterase